MWESRKTLELRHVLQNKFTLRRSNEQHVQILLQKQGSERSLKTSKVMKFKNFISQDWKVIEFKFTPPPPPPTLQINFSFVRLSWFRVN